MPVAPKIWESDEVMSMLRWLAGEGLSTAAIAQMLSVEFKQPVTRNMVIGKCRREGIALTSHLAIQRQQDPKPRIRTRLPHIAKKVRQPAPAYRTMECEPSGTGSTTLLDRRPDQCPFPYGNPQSKDFTVCGDARLGRLPYCAAHMRIAYQPVSQRQKEAA